MIRGHEEHDEELDQLDRLVLHGSDADPQARAVDFLAEETDRREEQQRAEHPEVFVGSQTADVLEERSGGDREPERDRQPDLLTPPQLRREPHHDGQANRRERQRQRRERVVTPGIPRASQHPNDRERAQSDEPPRRPERVRGDDAQSEAATVNAAATTPKAPTRGAKLRTRLTVR